MLVSKISGMVNSLIDGKKATGHGRGLERARVIRVLLELLPRYRVPSEVEAPVEAAADER